MSNLGFQIGKELGELKARFERMEVEKGCGCKGKTKRSRRRSVPKGVEEAFNQLVSALSEVPVPEGGQKLYIRSVIFTTDPRRAVRADDGIYCCSNACGESMCCNMDDDTCDNFCDEPC